jgi:hypothetical protein
MQELNMLGAGALQVNNAANIPRTQKQAVSQQAFNMKTAIATGLLDTVNHGYGAMEQGRAEELARSSARGISNGQTTYDEARMAASRVAGRHGSEFRAALSRHSTKEDIVQEATERAALAERNRARSVGFGNGPEALRARLADDPNHTAARESQEARNNSIRQAADRFDQSLQADGLSETARQFDSFEQMRGASQRGVTESREVAERAAQGAGQSRMQALGSALQTAQSIAAYRQLMRTQNDLGTLPQTPRRLIGLDTPGAAPTTPAIPGGSAVAAIDPGIDAGDDTSPAMARERMGSGIKTGGGFATGQYKPRQAQASSGGGGGGGFGGGGGPPNRAPASRQNLGPSSFDYGGSAGGGGRMNEFGGAAANAGGSDLQDAIKSLLGEGEKDPNQKLEEFRELASVQDGQNQEASVDNSRSLFERVNEKYNSLQNNGII